MTAAAAAAARSVQASAQFVLPAADDKRPAVNQRVRKLLARQAVNALVHPDLAQFHQAFQIVAAGDRPLRVRGRAEIADRRRVQRRGVQTCKIGQVSGFGGGADEEVDLYFAFCRIDFDAGVVTVDWDADF